MCHGCLHHVVATPRVDIEGNLAVGTHHRAVDDGVHALRRAAHVVRRTNVYAQVLMRRVHRLNVGDAQRVFTCKRTNHIRSETRRATENQHLHILLPLISAPGA